MPFPTKISNLDEFKFNNLFNNGYTGTYFPISSTKTFSSKEYDANYKISTNSIKLDFSSYISLKNLKSDYTSMLYIFSDNYEKYIEILPKEEKYKNFNYISEEDKFGITIDDLYKRVFFLSEFPYKFKSTTNIENYPAIFSKEDPRVNSIKFITKQYVDDKFVYYNTRTNGTMEIVIPNQHYDFYGDNVEFKIYSKSNFVKFNMSILNFDKNINWSNIMFTDLNYVDENHLRNSDHVVIDDLYKLKNKFFNMYKGENIKTSMNIDNILYENKKNETEYENIKIDRFIRNYKIDLKNDKKLIKFNLPACDNNSIIRFTIFVKGGDENLVWDERIKWVEETPLLLNESNYIKMDFLYDGKSIFETIS